MLSKIYCLCPRFLAPPLKTSLYVGAATFISFCALLVVFRSVQLGCFVVLQHHNLKKCTADFDPNQSQCPSSTFI